MKTRLFISELECCSCGRTAKPGAKRGPGEPVILALILYVYRRGTGKGTTSKARKVNVCEDCALKAGASSIFGMGKEGRAMSSALLTAFVEHYSGILDDEAKDAPRPAPAKSMELDLS